LKAHGANYAPVLKTDDTGATAHVATIRSRIDDFKRNGLHTSAAQEVLAQEQRDIIAHLVEMDARQVR
jgi:hypothetical protein